MEDVNIEKYLMCNYQKRKAWYGSNSIESQSYIFDTETKRASIRPNSKILEIGFGEGLFLDWAKAHSHAIIGIEKNQDFINLAKSKGHEVYFGNIEKVFDGQKEIFDLVVIFDVLEHMSIEEIYYLFNSLRILLKPNSRILCRIPNGLSPFGRYHQYADATHKSVLSSQIIEDISQISGLRVLSEHNSARYMNDRRHRVLLKMAAHIIRQTIQLFLGYIYFGKSIPLDPIVTVVIGLDNQKN